MVARPSSDLLGAEPLRRLLRRAARVVAGALAGDEPVAEPCPEAELERKAGVFVTLRHRGRLAGCIGYPYPDGAVWESSAAAAKAAALEDPRFPRLPVEAQPDIELEISVLTPPRPVGLQEFVPGIDGLILKLGGSSGLLLPQVATEHGLDRVGFLRALCRKAGLPESALRDERIELLAFRAQIDQAMLPLLLEESS